MSNFSDFLKSIKQKIKSVPRALNETISELPKASLPRFNIQNPVGNFAANILPSAAEDLINTPVNLIQGTRGMVRNQIDKMTGKSVRIQDELADASQTGEAMLNLATLGTFSGAKSLAKQGIKELLKKGLVEGGKYGTAYGLAQGIESGREDTVPEQIKKGVIGAGTGLVVGGVTGAGFAGATKIKLKNRPGFLKMDEILGKRKVSQIGSTLKPKDYPKAKAGMNLPDEVVASQYKLPTPEKINIHKKVVEWMDRSTTGFNPEKANGPISWLVDNLGSEKVKGLMANETSVSNFWKNALDESRVNNIPGWKVIEQEANRSLYNQTSTIYVPPIAKTAVTGLPTRSVSPKTIENVLKKTPDLGVEAKVDMVLNELGKLPDNSKVKGNEWQKHFKTGTETLKTLYKGLEQQVEKIVSKKDFVDMVEGKVPVDSRVQPLIDLHRKITDAGRRLTNDPEVGYLPEYFPHADTKSTKVMKTLFGDTLVNQLNLDEGFLKTREGTLVNYSKNYSEVMGDYAEQVMSRRYGVRAKSLSKIEQEILKHVETSKPNEIFNYTDKLGEVPVVERPKVNFRTDTIPIIGKSPRTINNIMDNIGGELFDDFGMVRDGKDLHLPRSNKLSEFIEKKDTEGVIEYLAKVMRVNEIEKKGFVESSVNAINELGIERYSRGVLKYASFERPMEKFMKSVSKYDFVDSNTKEAINTFIDSSLKKEKAVKSIADKMLDLASSTFARAQIFGNIKVGLVQPTEITRIPATMGWEALARGVWKGLTKKDEGFLYGFGDKTPNLEYIGDKVALKGKIGSVLKGVDKVGYSFIKWGENWKNKVFTGAAESQGMKLGLQGEDLIKYVRDNVYRYAYVADKFSTPLFMKDNSLARLAFQYGQYSLKSTYGIVDEFAAKRYGPAFGLIGSQVFNMGLIMAVTGIPLKFALESLIPLGTGPFFTFALDLLTSTVGLITSETDKEKDKNLGKLGKKTLTNLVPAGAQINKTASMIDIMKKGFAEAPSGAIKYLAPDNLVENAQGLIFGQSSTQSSRDFFDKDKGKILGESQTKMVQNLLESGNEEGAKTLYQSIMGNRKDNSKNLLDPSTKITPKDYTTSITPPGGSDFTIQQLLEKEYERDTKNRTVKAIQERSGEFKDYDKNTVSDEMLYTAKGITQEDQKTAFYYTLDSLKADKKAEIVYKLVQEGKSDFTTLFKNKVLDSSVAREMERKGYIDDADGFMEKLKMTDIYYQRKSLRKLGKKRIKAITAIQNRTTKALFAGQKTSISKLLATNKKYSKARRKRSILKKVKFTVPKYKSVKSYKPTYF